MRCAALLRLTPQATIALGHSRAKRDCGLCFQILHKKMLPTPRSTPMLMPNSHACAYQGLGSALLRRNFLFALADRSIVGFFHTVDVNSTLFTAPLALDLVAGKISGTASTGDRHRAVEVPGERKEGRRRREGWSRMERVGAEADEAWTPIRPADERRCQAKRRD